MRKKTIEAIKEHALKEYPNEACGFIVKDGRKELYVPVENSSTDPQEHFRIAPEVYADVEEQYTIMAVVHSHPEETSEPSEADRVLCEGSNLPWVIVGVHRDLVTKELEVHEPVQIVPEGYEAPLEGRIFHHGVLDCYSLVRDYYKRNLGIDLPNYFRADRWWEEQDAESLYEKYADDAGFYKVTDGTLKEHDMIVMEIGSSAGPNHAGIYIGENLFLHHMYGMPSTKAVYGGSYQYATRFVLRHKEVHPLD